MQKRWDNRSFSATIHRSAGQAESGSDKRLLRTRNIGIIAHIDAVRLTGGKSSLLLVLMILKGKTTTTERMLYYSGHTRRIGGNSKRFFSFLGSIKSWKFHFLAHPISSSDQHVDFSFYYTIYLLIKLFGLLL